MFRKVMLQWLLPGLVCLAPLAAPGFAGDKEREVYRKGLRATALVVTPDGYRRWTADVILHKEYAQIVGEPFRKKGELRADLAGACSRASRTASSAESQPRPLCSRQTVRIRRRRRSTVLRAQASLSRGKFTSSRFLGFDHEGRPFGRLLYRSNSQFPHSITQTPASRIIWLR
jgi:hypothetical protein